MFINFQVGKLINNFLYFSSYEHCGLYKLDIVQQKLSFLCFFPEEDILQKSLHSKVLSFGDCLFFIPGLGGMNLHIYNLVTEDIKCVPLLRNRGWSGEAFIEDGYLWMIPFSPNKQPAVRLDINSLDVREFPHFFGELIHYNSRNYEQLLKRMVVADKSVWFGIYHSNEIVQISLNNLKIKKYRVEIDDLFGIFLAQHEMWITSFKQKFVYKWSPERGIYEKCEVQDLTENIMPYNHIFEAFDSVFALPFKSGNLSKYNENTKNFQILLDYPIGFHFDNVKKPRFYKYDYDNDIIICFPFNSPDILLMDIKKNIMSHFTPCMTLDEDQEPYLSIINAKFKQRIIYEDNFLDLGEYLQFINT